LSTGRLPGHGTPAEHKAEMPLDQESKEAISHCCWCCQCNCGMVATGRKMWNSYSPPKDVLANSWWCCYCCCAGCGMGPCASPCAALTYKCICCKNTCESADCLGLRTNEGVCSVNHRCLFCTYLCQLPRIDDGTPCCMCCGSNCANCRHDFKKQLWDCWTCHMACFRMEPWWCCHSYCCGCGIHEYMTDRQWYYSSTKCCPVRCTLASARPCDRDGICQFLSFCCCWYSQCQCPPTVEGNPGCSCCGFGGTAQHPTCGPRSAPKQQEMDGTV